MTRVELRVTQAGVATVQDLGRPGFAAVGIAANGAADAFSAQSANILVGNLTTAPLIEITGSDFALSTTADLVIAVTGAAESVEVNGGRQPVGEPLLVPAGARIVIPAPTVGLRSHLAFNGQLEAELVLGSVAPDRLLETGRALRPGDTVVAHTLFSGLDHPHLRIPVFRLGLVAPPIRNTIEVQTTIGPDAHEFPAHLRGQLPDTYEVSPQSDHIGLRLLGPTPARSTPTEILSRGVPVGAIEVPPAGGLLLLLRGRLVTAGYPVVAVATGESIDRLGQARPGSEIRFQVVDADRARAAYQQRQLQLDQLAARVARAFGAVGLGRIIEPASPSGSTKG